MIHLQNAEEKWGIQLRDEDSETQGDPVVTPMDEDSCIDPALRQPQQTTSDPEASGALSIAPVAETQAIPHDPSNAEISQEHVQEVSRVCLLGRNGS